MKPTRRDPVSLHVGYVLLAVVPALLLVCVMLPAAAQDAEWLIGMASVKITPDKPMELAGYANRVALFTGVTSDLHAKALALQDKDGHRALLITADILGFPRKVTDEVCAEITKRTGLPREAMLLNGSHTHAGPVMTSRISIDTSDETWARVNAYTAVFHRKVVDMALKAMDDMQPAKLSWGTGVAKFVMNRRQLTADGIILGSNPRGLADRSVPVLRIDRPNGELRGVLFGAACHCTTQGGDNLLVDAEWAGYAQRHIEESFPGVQAMFMAGCGGDANPFMRGTLDLARQHGADLGDEVARVLALELAPVRGPIRTAYACVDLPLQQFKDPEELDKLAEADKSYRKWFIDTAKKYFAEQGKIPEVYNAPFAVWQFGEDLTLVGYSGETLVDYVKFAERDLGPLKLWVAGYCNDLYGYLPSARVLAEGGYETRGLYVDAGLFTPEVEEVVMDTIERLARQAGRPAKQ